MLEVCAYLRGVGSKYGLSDQFILRCLVIFTEIKAVGKRRDYQDFRLISLMITNSFRDVNSPPIAPIAL